MLTVITIILSSSVLAALFTSLTNLYMKRKELYVQIKLEEKNKWLSEISEGIKEYTSRVVDYNNELMRYSIEEINEIEIANKLILCKKAHNNLILYIYQADYNNQGIEEIENIIGEVTDIINNQREIVNNYLYRKIAYKELTNEMGKSEIEIGKKTYELSEKLGTLIRLEKKELINATLKSRTKKILIEIFNNPPK